jgi:hypothetical protein
MTTGYYPFIRKILIKKFHKWISTRDGTLSIAKEVRI